MTKQYDLFEMVVKRIRDLRRARRWSQEKLAEKAGLSRDAISRIERGDREPRLETLKLIAEALGLKLSKMLDFDAQPRSSREREAQLRGIERSLDMVPPPMAEALITAIRLIAQAQAKLTAEEARLPRAGERPVEYGKRPRGPRSRK